MRESSLLCKGNKLVTLTRTIRGGGTTRTFHGVNGSKRLRIPPVFNRK